MALFSTNEQKRTVLEKYVMTVWGLATQQPEDLEIGQHNFENMKTIRLLVN